MELTHKQTTPLQNAIAVASLIGGLMSSYSYDEKRERISAIGTIRSRIKKFLYVRSRSNKKEFLSAVSYADSAWQSTINYFDSIKPEIEVVATTLRLYSLYSKELNKYANINEKQIEAFVKGLEFDISLKLEQTSYEVADFLLDELAKYTNIKRRDLALLIKKDKELNNGESLWEK